jgi:hypothetical protein
MTRPTVQVRILDERVKEWGIAIHIVPRSGLGVVDADD